MKNIKYIIGSLVVISFLFVSCEKEYDAPNVDAIPVGAVKTIAEVRAMHQPGFEVRITEDMSVYGVVTADESTGNLYKEAYMQDETGGLYLRFQSTGGVYIGDSIRVYLKGSKIIKYNQMLQVDSLDADNNIQKIATEKYWTPEIEDISNITNNVESFQAKLIQLNNVSFVEANQGKTYADGDNNESETRVLQNLNGDLIDVRTSGYANFANDTLPGGNGTFIGVVAQYNSGVQLIIRNPAELTMTGDLPEEIIKDFEDQDVTSGGWTTQYPSGSINWTTDDYNSNYYGYITNGSAKNVGESWLISPALDLSNSSSPVFNFKTATYASNTALEVLISENYDGTSNPSSATWTNVTSQVSFSQGSWDWISSGDVDLSSYNGSAVYIAFKYTGTSSSWDTWEVDNIRIIK